MTNAMSDKSTEGQAGAIEITPEMIEAGVGALFDRYSDDVFDDPRTTVGEIYRAMASLAFRSRLLSRQQV